MVRKSAKNSFLIQGIILAVASIIVRIIGLVYRIPLTNIIGDEGMGYYSVAFEVYSIALILSSYSIPLAVSKLVVSKMAVQEYKNAYKIFKGALLFAICTGGVVALIIFFGADIFVTKSPRSAMPLRVLAPTIFIVAIMGVFRGYFQGIKTMIPTSISQIVEQIVNAFVSVYAAYFLMKSYSASLDIAAYGAMGGTLGTLMGAVTGLLLLLFVFAIYRPVIKRQRRRDKTGYIDNYQQIFKVLVITITPVILSTTVYNISGIIDITIFGNILSGKGMAEEERSALIGIFSNKYRVLINVPIAMASAIATAMIPTLTQVFTNGLIKEVKEKIQLSIKFCMIIAIPSSVGIAVLASPILKLLFNDGRELPANLIIIGAVSIILFSLSTVTNAVLQGINKMKLPVINSTISLIIHIIAVVIMLQWFDMHVYALVIGNILFSLIICIFNAISIKKYLGYRQEILKTFIIPLASATVMGGVTFLIYFAINKLLNINSISTFISIIFGVMVYFITLLILKGVNEEELSKLPKGATWVRIAKRFRLL